MRWRTRSRRASIEAGYTILGVFYGRISKADHTSLSDANTHLSRHEVDRCSSLVFIQERLTKKGARRRLIFLGGTCENAEEGLRTRAERAPARSARLTRCMWSSNFYLKSLCCEKRSLFEWMRVRGVVSEVVDVRGDSQLLRIVNERKVLADDNKNRPPLFGVVSPSHAFTECCLSDLLSSFFTLRML